ncbi:hypothetical protein BST61_g6641 [Cercospora zeina]
MDYGYSTTSYGAQGGNTGGGFMPGSQNENSASNKRTYGKDTLRPVTIKQLLDAHHPHPDADHFMIDDSETTQVTFVGQIRNISAQTTNVTYKVDDGTGIIEVKVWVDADTLAAEESGGMVKKDKPVEQGYARVWGRLKQFNSKRHVGAQYIRAIEDYNEIAYHLLEATVVHLHFAKGPVDQLQQQGGQANGGGQQVGMANGAGAAAGSDLAGLSMAARKVLQALRATPQTNEGLHAQVIAQHTGMELTEVYKAGDELMGLGKVYTTVDDMTWALLDL